MGDHTSLTSLLIVVVIAFVIPILLHQLRLKMLPVVVAEILAGLIIGESGFNLIREDAWLELLSSFGLIYLMFLSGMEIDFSQFRRKSATSKKGPNPLLASMLVFIGILAISYGLSEGLVRLGFVSEPYLMTIIIATISLGVVVPVLKERQLIETPFGQTVLLITVISDFVTMILLAVFISSRSGSMDSMLLLLAFFLIVIVVYVSLRRFTRRKFVETLLQGTAQLGTRGVFALLLLFVVMSENMGVESILGAFLAGVIVSLLAPDKSFQHSLETFGYGFLIPIFFVMTGVNLNIWELFGDIQILLFIPVLLVVIFLSKLIPSMLLRIWYDGKHTLSAGLLLSSTLSLVIAAATVALNLGLITSTMQGALILVAIITCFVAPVLFNRFLPPREKKPTKVSIIGANHITLPVSLDLLKEGFAVDLFSAQPSGLESKEEQYKRYPLRELPRLDIVSLTDRQAFDADILVCGSLDDQLNMQVARHARKIGIERIIVRLEDPERMEQAQEEGFAVFSTLYASRTLLRGMVQYPGAVGLITTDDSIQEVVVRNPAYNNVMLKDMPVLGPALVLRIYRGKSFIIPHGSTAVLVGDRLLVSGDPEHIEQMKQALQ